MRRTILVAWVFANFISDPVAVGLTDSDWASVHTKLKDARIAANTPAKHTKCSAAGVCLEVSRWLYQLGWQQAYRQNLIDKANEILDIASFSNAPWAVYYDDIGITILATEHMAYLFRHNASKTVFLETIYQYYASLDDPNDPNSLDFIERQRLYICPSGNLTRDLWKVTCARPNGTNRITLESSNATGLTTSISNTNGTRSSVSFIWNNLQIPGTERRIKVVAKVEVYTGNQSISGISRADNRHGTWWIDVDHLSGGDVHLWSIEYPIIDKSQAFWRFTDKSYFALPYLTGVEFETGQVIDTDVDTDLNLIEYPGGQMPYQFVASYQRGAGMIYYCDDRGGFRKALKTQDNGTGTYFSWVHYPKMQGHSSATFNYYPCRIGVFKGDWYDAAVWYRNYWLDEFAGFLPSLLRGEWLLDAHHGTYSSGTLNSEWGWLDSALDNHFPGTSFLGSHMAYDWRNDFIIGTTKYSGQCIYEPWFQAVSQSGKTLQYEPLEEQHYCSLKS